MNKFLIAFISCSLVFFYCFSITGQDAYNFLVDKGYTVNDLNGDILNNDIIFSDAFITFDNYNKKNNIFNYLHNMVDWGQSFTSYKITNTFDSVGNALDAIGKWFVQLFRK